MKKVVLLSAAGVALAYPLAATAQTSDVAASAEAPPARDGEIIVTAQRREQKLQDVPVAVTAIGGPALEQARITSITDLQTATPGLATNTANRPGTSTQITVRGVGTAGNDPGLEAAVGFSVDGVYRARSGAGLGDFVDVESVEVLRGPQGTLFGKNTTAGAIQVTTRKPDLDDFGGFVEGTVGNYNLVRLRGAVNVPLSQDKIAMRISAGYNKRDGFIKDPLNDAAYNDRDRFTIAGKLRFKLGESVEALLAADYSEADESCCQPVRYSNGQTAGANSPYIAFLAARAALHNNTYPVNPDYTTRITSVNGPIANANKDRGVSLTVNADFGGATLTSVTSYRKFTDNEDNDVDFSGAAIVNQKIDFGLRVFSQELRLQGQAFDNRLDWLIGGYFSSEKIDYHESIRNGVDADAYFTFLSASLAGLYPTMDDAYGTFATQRNKSYALFTHNIFEITDGLHLTAGLRWTKEDKSAISAPYYNGPTRLLPRAAIAPVGAPANPYALSRHEDAFSGTAVLDYKWTPDIMTYASYSHGFKAGGFALGRDGAGPVYSRNAACSASGNIVQTVPGLGNIYRCDVKDPNLKAETVDSYEIGLRSQFFDRRLTFNLTLFNSDYKNLQLNTFSGTGFFLSNAGTARSRGVEVEAGVRIADGVRIGGNVTYLDAKYGAGVPAVLSGEPALGGKRLNNAPTWSGAFTANIDRPISDSVDFFARPEVYFTEGFYSASRVSSFGTELKLPAYTLFNLSAGFRIAGKYEISAFCRNCTDKTYIGLISSAVAQSGGKDAFLGNPAEYGASLRFEF